MFRFFIIWKMNKQNKGKKATRGEKQILEENVQTIKFYFYLHAGSNAAYLLLRYLLRWDDFTTKYIVLYCLTLFLSSAGYYFISHAGRPLKDENGLIVGAGSDLNMPGHISGN